MHTSDYIISLFRSFFSLPMVSQIRSNCPLSDIQRGPWLGSAPSLFIATVLQIPAELWANSYNRPALCPHPLPRPSFLTLPTAGRSEHQESVGEDRVHTKARWEAVSEVESGGCRDIRHGKWVKGGAKDDLSALFSLGAHLNSKTIASLEIGREMSWKIGGGWGVGMQAFISRWQPRRRAWKMAPGRNRTGDAHSGSPVWGRFQHLEITKRL